MAPLLLLALASHVAAAQSDSFVRRMDPFPVSDSAGHRIAWPFLGGLDHPRPQLVDIDGDGDLDLFVQEYTGRMMFFENVGTRDSAAFAFRSDDYQGLDIGEWSRFVDYDGDGDLDLFSESPYSYIRVFRNIGNPHDAHFALAADTLRDTIGAPIFSDRQNIPQITDVDCNGRLDLLLGRASGMVTRYEAAGVGDAGVPRFAFVTDSFQGIQIIGAQFGNDAMPGAAMPGGVSPPGPGPGPYHPPSMHGANTMIVTDLDQDGDPDILWGDYFEAGLLWLVNSGSCRHPRIGRDTVHFPGNAPIRTSGYNAPAVGDLTGDGKLDVLVGVLGGAYNPDVTSTQNLYYLKQTGPLQWTLETKDFLPSIDVGSESSPALVDLDGDGDLDLVIGNKLDPEHPRTAALLVYRNTGSATAPEFKEAERIPIAGDFHLAPAFGDLDGDGKPDLILGTWRSSLLYYHNDGTRQTPRFTLADSAVVTLTRGSYAMPALVDIDGDGDLDLFVGESSGEINYYRNDGSPKRPRFTLVSDVYDSIEVGRRSAPSFADLNGDGLPDMIIGTEAGPTVVYRNAGTRSAPKFVRDSALTLQLLPLSAPAAGDLDGNGTPELVVGNAGGGLIYFENRGRPADRRRKP